MMGHLESHHQVVHLKLYADFLAYVIGELNVCLCHFSKKILQPNASIKIIAVTLFVRKNQFANSQPLPKLFKYEHMGNYYAG